MMAQPVLASMQRSCIKEVLNARNRQKISTSSGWLIFEEAVTWMSNSRRSVRCLDRGSPTGLSVYCDRFALAILPFIKNEHRPARASREQHNGSSR